MAIQLQKFAHKLSPYARPNQSWVCGKQAQGYSCEAGPDQQGYCRTEFECKPYKENEKWICTRSLPYGGECIEGPMPDGTCCRPVSLCQPIRSIRKKRSLFVRWCVFFTFAVILFLLTSSLKDTFFNPGDLSFKHATIEKCSTCHELFDKSLFTWIDAAWSGNNVVHNSKQCLECHRFGENANNAHGLDSEKLKQLMQSADQPLDKAENQLACMTCHQEHQGSGFNLTAVARQDCAFCHQLKQSFINAQHPVFDQYPYKRNTKIIFDHNTHANKYYYNRAGDKLLETAPKSCNSCHQNDENGIKMLPGSYDKNCKACHNDIFEEADSYIVFELPDIDKEPIDFNIEWPQDASGTITNLMVLLLASDRLFIEAVSGLDDYFDLTGLDEKKTLMLIIAIKNLFYEIENKGSIVFKQRLAAAFNCRLNDQGQLDPQSQCKIKQTALDRLDKLFPIQLFCVAKQRWFPNMKGNDVITSVAELDHNNNYCTNSRRIKPRIQQGEWTLEEFSIEYQPDSHKDTFFQALLNLTRYETRLVLIEKTRMEIFTELNSEEAPVQCTKCHSVESKDGKNFRVNWLITPTSSRQKEFIKFKHDAHIKYQQDTICNDCHIENKKGDYLASYENLDPYNFDSNFTTEREVCLSCHQQSMTEEQCQLCHNYHVGL